MAGKCGTVISEVWRYESALVALNTAKDAILRAFGIEGRKYVSDGSYCRHGVEIAIDDCIVSRTGWWQIREEGKVISLIDGDTVSYFYIVGRCPADDIEQRSTAVVYCRHPEMIGVRMPSGFHHLRHDERGQMGAKRLDVVEGHAMATERLTNFLSGVRVRNELFEPFVRDDHRANCSRKRTSES